MPQKETRLRNRNESNPRMARTVLTFERRSAIRPRNLSFFTVVGVLTSHTGSLREFSETTVAIGTSVRMSSCSKVFRHE